MTTAKRITTPSRRRSLPQATPYYDVVSKSTKYGTKGVYTPQMPRKAKRK